MLVCPWSNNQLKSLSRHIRDGTTAPENLPAYSDVMLWYNDVAATVQQAISNLDWSPLLGGRAFEVTSRPKTIDTLRQKLQRDPNTPLPSVQDVAGVRFEAEMSLDEQDAVARAIAGLYDQDPSCVKDLRATPHSGYRAVHVWLRLPVRVEVQVRTHMQSAWANAYEAVADVIGRDIRYGQMPENDLERGVVEALQDVSLKAIAPSEEMRNAREQQLLRMREDASAGTPVFDQQVRDKLEAEWASHREAELELRDQLREIHDQFRAIRGKV
ncbi:RelA/SpoT domain-containing protein [Microbacterium trichothecenolyticum]